MVDISLVVINKKIPFRLTSRDIYTRAEKKNGTLIGSIRIIAYYLYRRPDRIIKYKPKYLYRQ